MLLLASPKQGDIYNQPEGDINVVTYGVYPYLLRAEGHVGLDLQRYYFFR